MVEAMSLKALARQILARERKRESLSQRGPNGSETLGECAVHRAPDALVPLAATPEARVVSPAVSEPGMEQPCATRRGRVQALDGALLHFCARCGRFAAFGYGVRLRAGQFGRWYRGEHRPPKPDC